MPMLIANRPPPTRPLGKLCKTTIQIHPLLFILSSPSYTLAVFYFPLIVSLHFLFLLSLLCVCVELDEVVFLLFFPGKFISNLRGDSVFIDSTSYALKVLGIISKSS